MTQQTIFQSLTKGASKLRSNSSDPKNIFFLKTSKTGSTTMMSIFQRYGLRHEMNFLLGMCQLMLIFLVLQNFEITLSRKILGIFRSGAFNACRTMRNVPETAPLNDPGLTQYFEVLFQVRTLTKVRTMAAWRTMRDHLIWVRVSRLSNVHGN